MKQITIDTVSKKILADVYTPVGVYLRLRDKFRDTILLESADTQNGENNYSIIGIQAIGGIEITNTKQLEYKIPGQKPEKKEIKQLLDVPDLLFEFSNRFTVPGGASKEEKFAQGLFGYTTYDAVCFFDSVHFSKEATTDLLIPMMRYRMYQYVVVFDHFKDELHICENRVPGVAPSDEDIETIILGKNVPRYPFATQGNETSNITDEAYIEMVKNGIASCYRGDVFQIVLSRRFHQQFIGDEFNVYRALRSINPSPYLFYFDYGDYKLFGSSPESQLKITNGQAVVHPIAGTFRRTGNETIDALEAERLLADPKENAEHVMLVDLARNDLSRVCDDIEVLQFRQAKYFSHVIHLVSEVTGAVKPGSNTFNLLAKTFPAGTLSGAPKIKAMELIDKYEPQKRSFYGGAIGYFGFEGDFNHAIMIRTFLSKQNVLVSQAGAGVVAASKPESELQEVNNKLMALKKAIELAEKI